MSREEIEKLANEFSPMMFADVLRYWGEDAAQALTALLAENERLERIVIQARKVSEVLAVCGYPVSDAHWKNASGGMSVEARGLHLAADDLRNALNKDPDQ